MMDNALITKTLDLAVKIQQIPAPTFEEQLRGEFVSRLFHEEGLQDVQTDSIGNVYGRLPGSGDAKPLVISAHLDTIFPASTDLEIRIEPGRIFGPGIGDNSMGVAGLFGLLWALRRQLKLERQARSPLPGDIWMVANVGEEGLGDLRGMRAVVDRFEDRVLAYIILEGMALGQIYHRALGVERYRIRVKTQGGHSWVDYGRPSAIHELAGLVTQLNDLPVPQSPRSTMNVGVFSGGMSVNTIAPEAQLELDLRSENQSVLKALARSVIDLVQSVKRTGVEVSFERIGLRPAGELPHSHPLVRLAQRCLLEQGIQPNLTIGSTDANIPLSHGLPAICLGVTNGTSAHTEGEYIFTEPVAAGLAQLVAMVVGVFELSNG